MAQWTTASEPGPASETVDETDGEHQAGERSLAVGLVAAEAAGALCPVAGSKVVSKTE